MFRRGDLYPKLRLLREFDLPDFLTGCRFAYPLVTRAMYRNDWEMLEPLVLPNCFDAMRQAMEDFSVAGRRVVDDDSEDAIVVRTAVLSRALVEVPEGEVGDAPIRCNLDVRFEVTERFAIWDYHENEAIAAPDTDESGARTQHSTWRFEGAVPAVRQSGEHGDDDAAAEDASSAEEDEETGWRLLSIS